jgi:hypothetical protein
MSRPPEIPQFWELRSLHDGTHVSLPTSLGRHMIRAMATARSSGSYGKKGPGLWSELSRETGRYALPNTGLITENTMKALGTPEDEANAVHLALNPEDQQIALYRVFMSARSEGTA